MAEGVFLDTVGLIALLSRDDEYHPNAADVFHQIGQAERPVITTDLVLAEVGNGLARTALREDVCWLIGELEASAAATVVYVDRRQFAEGLALYAARADKRWGLVDCVSFVVMKAMGLTDAFTADRHFQQAGLKCLMSPVRGR